jgi:hypothetical protein
MQLALLTALDWLGTGTRAVDTMRRRVPPATNSSAQNGCPSASPTS